MFKCQALTSINSLIPVIMWDCTYLFYKCINWGLESVSLLRVTKLVERVTRQFDPGIGDLNHGEDCQVAFLRVVFLKLNMKLSFFNVSYPIRTPKRWGNTMWVCCHKVESKTLISIIWGGYVHLFSNLFT